MAKSKTGLYAGIAAVVVVVAIIIGVVVTNNNKGGDSGGESSQSSSLTAADFAKVDVAVEYGDYDAMEALAKSIQNGEMTGKVVKIDGLASHPMTKYSIVEPSADGSKKIGTEFIIEGAEEPAYPSDGAKVVITGKVVEKEPLYFIIKTIPEMVVKK